MSDRNASITRNIASAKYSIDGSIGSGPIESPMPSISGATTKRLSPNKSINGTIEWEDVGPGCNIISGTASGAPL